MTPYLQMRALYIEHHRPGEMTWEELVGWHLADPLAHIVKAPTFFVMGRAVSSAAPPAMIRDLTFLFSPGECDAWHLWAFAGDMNKAWRALPHELPFLAWERIGDPGKELRFISAAAIHRHSRTHGI